MKGIQVMMYGFLQKELKKNAGMVAMAPFKKLEIQYFMFSQSSPLPRYVSKICSLALYDDNGGNSIYIAHIYKEIPISTASPPQRKQETNFEI